MILAVNRQADPLDIVNARRRDSPVRRSTHELIDITRFGSSRAV